MGQIEPINNYITINDLNDNAPTFTSNASFSADENQTAVGTVTATDADTGTTISFSLSGTDASSLTINSSSGVLAFSSAPDYETKSSFSATVTASDGINTTDQQVTITINNLNDNAPTFTSNASFSADENQTTIGTVTATDADDDNITYSISGTDASSLTINSSSGILAFKSAPDYETKSSYSVTVTASDGENSDSQNLTVTINNLNDNAPTFTSNASFSADENQTAVGTVTATDADGDIISYSVSGTDASALNIDLSTGVLAFNSAPDHETKSSYSIIATASDGTNSSNQNILLTINDLNDSGPVFVVTQYSFDEVNSFQVITHAILEDGIGILNATDDLGNTDESIEFQRRLGGSASPDATDIGVEKRVFAKAMVIAPMFFVGTMEL